MCDFCENIEEYGIKEPYLDIDGELLYSSKENKYYIVLNDVWNDYFYEKEVELCPLCGRKLSEETKHSDPIRQTIKEVTEEMPVLGKYDGDYAFPCGAYGYMDGLYRVDFSCSNCGKRHEGATFGTEIVCDCGKKIKTGYRKETENE